MGRKHLQNYGSSPAPVLYYVFDVMVLTGQDVMHLPLEERRELLEKRIGGYTRGTKTFDALVFGYYERDRLTKPRLRVSAHCTYQDAATESASSGRLMRMRV